MAIVFPHLSVNLDGLAYQGADIAHVAKMIGKHYCSKWAFPVLGAKIEILHAILHLAYFFYFAGDAEHVADFFRSFGEGNAGRGGDIVEKEKREDESQGGQDIISSVPCAGSR